LPQPLMNDPDRRLDSWKEIAAFFGRDERTVRRWEKENALPIHRVPGGAKGRVFAYESELRQWLSTPQAADSAISEPKLPSEPVQAIDQIRPIGRMEVIEQAPAVGRPEALHTRLSSSAKWAVALSLCALLAVGIFVYRKGHRFAAYASVPRPTQDSRKPATPQAEEFYLKGRYYWNKRTPDDLNKALDYFMQAVVQDPNYAKAYVGLADCYNLMREYTLMPSNQAYPRALAAAKKAVELDDQSSEAHASLAFVLFFGQWDIANGEREFRRAIDLNPNNATAHHWYANALMTLRRIPEAQTEMDHAQALEPSSSSILADKGNLLIDAGQRDAALTLLKQMEEREPSFHSPHLYLKYLYLRSQDYPDFLSELRTDATLLHDDSAQAIANAAEKGFAAGGARGMFKGMLQAQQKLYLQHSLSPTELAKTYALLGNKPEALRYLATAYEQHDEELLFIESFFEFNILRDEPAYRDLLARMNLPAPEASATR